MESSCSTRDDGLYDEKCGEKYRSEPRECQQES